MTKPVLVNNFDPIGQFKSGVASGPPWQSIVDFATHKSFCGKRRRGQPLPRTALPTQFRSLPIRSVGVSVYLGWSPLGEGTQLTDPNEAVPREVGGAVATADLRARLNDELGFHPASLDEESIADFRRSTAEQAERLARYDRNYATPGGSDEPRYPALRDPVVAGDLRLGAAFDEYGGDDQAGFRHPWKSGRSVISVS